MGIAVTVLPVDRLGPFQSAAVDIPPDATGWFRLLLNIEDLVHINPLLAIWWRVFQFNAGKGTWDLLHAARWQGGKGSVAGAKVGTALRVFDPDAEKGKAPDYRGGQLRIEIESDSLMKIGYTIEFVDNPHL